ncbi:chaplin [Streptomyces shenzhenensis]|uniref:chaplin n=1 Tax=Streptomyces shenzhenensis TaxID=943815 RepID=UPI0036867E7A
MKRLTRNGVIVVAAASGAMAVAMPAHADSAADGSAVGSPGVISGNTLQVPVHVPVNVCGNTVNVAGLLNPAAGNTCANESGTRAASHTPGAPSGAAGVRAPEPRAAGGVRAGAPGGGGSGTASSGGAASTGSTSSSGGAGSWGGATAQGGAKGSSGLLSGNAIQVPVDIPVNVSGNSVNVVGIGNPAVGNESVNTPGDQPAKPTPRPETPAPPRAHHPAPPAPRSAAPQADVALAHTGADLTAPAVAASAALLVSGAVLYRRYRPGARR